MADGVSDAGLHLALHGSARILTLARPKALNAINDVMVAAFNRVLDDAQADAGCTAIVITGEGRSFCSGADLKSARARAEGSGSEGADRATRAFVRSVTDLMLRIECFPCPVIAAVQGMALAGGLELVLCCDLVLAADSAKFGDAHANYGLLPGGGGSVRLPRKIGPTRAKQMMFTGELFSAATMRDWGMVNEVVSDIDLNVRVENLLERLANKSPIGLRQMKRLVDEGLKMSPNAALELEQTVFAEHSLTHDRREGLAAFAEKRQPRFTGY
ncbi:MAG: enoyl-CoA hydratase/isomerase family protein [Betaproteobacteria bacterium]|nr:enoyl-CoA hydratase/isomerase family protein [Betaproteobacteria bacterium]NCA23253.1 enoyl-CoA hydratase/isomerase family protein [Betaproteobacteria bacterium]NDE53289.1 enoyl-CoA hydratase/isomerase family protein [Actinomycetota bacterium]